MDSKHAGRCARGIGARLQPFLRGVQQLTAIADVFIGFGPAIGGTIWGVVEVALLLGRNASGYFEKLSDLLETIGDDCPRYQDYAFLHRTSDRLQVVPCANFEQIVRLSLQAVKISRKPAAIRPVRTAFWPFDAEFGPIQSSLDNAAEVGYRRGPPCCCKAVGRRG